MSLSRLHPQRIQAAKRLSESVAEAATNVSTCSRVEDVTLENEAEAQAVEADMEVRKKASDKDICLFGIFPFYFPCSFIQNDLLKADNFTVYSQKEIFFRVFKVLFQKSS